MSGPPDPDEDLRRSLIGLAIDELDARLDEHRPADDRAVLVRAVAMLYRELDAGPDR